LIKIAPSILAADFTRLGEQVSEAEAAGADYIHVDVMDGHFVPNMTVGPLVVEALRRVTTLPLDVHLMVEKPEYLIPSFAAAGASVLTVHVETCPHLYRTIKQIKEAGLRAGVTLDPATSVLTLEEIIPYVDLVLVMTVEPGFGGQSFIPCMLSKISRTRELLESADSQAELEVDGGIDRITAPQVVKAGANVLVAGTAVFQMEGGVSEGIRAIRESVQGIGAT
jgi:ribulose-phosphate 3-epimerase